MKIKFLIALSLLPALLVAQIQTPFTQRTSIYSPERKIYNIQGDYTIIGNTNLTLSSTELDGDNDNDTPNSNNNLKYVDVDNDANTFNSSTAALTFSQEYGANPNCTEVVYAGLYWTGRTNDNNLNTNISEDMFVGYGATVGGLTLHIDSIDGTWNSTMTLLYTLICDTGDTLRITVKKIDNNRYNVTDGSTGITQIDCAGRKYDNTAGGSRGYAYVHLNTPIEWRGYTIDLIRFYSSTEVAMRQSSGIQCTKNLGDYPKNKIKIKHANANEYRTIEASPNDIYMDQMGDFIYVSYAEVTEYVQQYGLGNYTVADLVTNKGNGGSLGYLGCWGMVVVYENSSMKWRDITLFDGYASLHQDFYELEIPIEGFRTVQVGRVNMKLGMMAAEGDRNMAGDSCFIQKQSDHSWFPLIHDGADSLSNFFNSSIQTGGNYRYPNYVNNTGIDIIVMDVPNPNNEVITNEQTSTVFKFTTRPRFVEADDHEQYHPFCFVMGVDAYVPDAEAISGVMHLDTTVFWDDEAGYYTIPPGSIVEFEVDVRNYGTEDILDAKLEIPLPSTIEYYSTEVLYTYPGVTADFYFDAERNANGTAGWAINYLYSGDPNQVYVTVKLTCKVTEDCFVLASTDEDCLLALHVNGTLEGTSYVNNVYFKKESFISGFGDGECAGTAIRNDIWVVVDKEGWIAENCDEDIDYTYREINVCGDIYVDGNPVTGDSIPFMNIYNLYPQGSRFFHSVTGVEYTVETGFPLDVFGDIIHVQSSSVYSAECSSDLMLTNITAEDSLTYEPLALSTDTVIYCLGDEALPLSESVTIADPSRYYARYYRDNSGDAPAELDIIPSTSAQGTTTYYVRQFLKNSIGCEDDTYYPITIVVVSPITLVADRTIPTCEGEVVNITATPAGGTFSYPQELEEHITVSGNVLTFKNTMPAGNITITYNHSNITDNPSNCEISQLTYEHQIAAPTVPGTLNQDEVICEGSQISPLTITGLNGHVERWEWTTDTIAGEWDTIPNNTTSISSADLGDLSAGNYYFRALVKDGNCASVWTNTVHIEVLTTQAPEAIEGIASPQYACIGTVHTIQVPEGYSYHWYNQPIGGWPDNDLRNVTVTNSWVTRYVSVVSSNENECESIRSEIVVRPNVDPGIISSAGQFVCEIGSDPVTIGSQPTDDRDGQAHVFPSGTVEYQWYVTTTNENGTTSTELISGATLETFTPTDYMSQEGVFIFTRKVKAVGCDDWQQSDGSWRLSIGNPDATISTSPTSILPCNPSEETPITLTAVGPGTKYSYKWYYNDDEIAGSVSQTIQVTNPGEYKVQVTHKNSGCVATTTIPISIVIDTQGPNVENGETIIPCSKEYAHNVTIYETVEEIEAGLDINIMDNIVDDNLLTLALTDSIVTANPTDVCYKIERIYTVTDNCNNSNTLTHTIKVIDTVKPVIATTAVNNTDLGCNPTTIVAPTFTGTDNCAGDISSNITVTAGEVIEDDCKRTQTWTATYTDACGNAADTVSITYTWIEDMEAPMLNDVWPTLQAQNSCFANRDTTGLYSNEAVKALYTDCTEITVSSSNTTIGNNCGWIVTRTYTITDACGNSITNTMSVSGRDSIAPYIMPTVLDSTLTSTNCVFKIPDMREIVRNISTDCSEITVTQPSAGMVVYPMVAERDTTVNVIVTDICGNSSVKEVIITIPAKVTISAMATPAVICNGDTSQLSATPANVVGTAVYAWAPATELSSATIANPTVTLTASGASETVTYTVMVTDDNGCTATATASVTVNPEVVMNSVADWTLCVGETSPEYVYTSTITDGTVTYEWRNDNSAIGLAASGTGNLPSFVAANSTSANLIAEVKVAPTYANNGISCQGDSINFHITVRPSIKTPGNVAFTCPADTTVVLSYSECEQFVNIGYPEFVNNMTNMNVVITNDAPTDSIFTEGTTIVTWTATDECGATLECHQNITVVFPPCGTPNDSVADFDGYRYSSVRIGCQCWTGENARSEHYSDGTPVDNFRYYNDSDSLENIYGKLYTWYTAVRVPEGDNNAEPSVSTDPLGRPYVQGICPEGWALPTVDEYMLMIANSGDATHAKDGSNLYWLPGYEGQPPFSGFDAYGAGKYNGAIDRYQDLLGKTYFWTTLSGSGSETATTVEINYYCAEGLQTELSKGDGVSIRCLRKE